MILGAESLSALFTGLRAIFNEAVEGTEDPAIERLLEKVPSVNAAENYPVGALLGDLEEVLDEVTITNIGAWIQKVDNKTFARAVQVRRDDIADDNIGVYRGPVRALGRRAALYPLRLAAETLLAGLDDDWIDEHPVFYAADRLWPVGDITWNNRNDVALTADNFDAAVLALETRNDPAGAPLGLGADLLVCGPQNRAAAETIVELERTAAGASNRHYKKADLLVLKRFAASEAWFVMDTEPMKPLVLQDREPAEFTAKEDPNSDDAFYRERYAYKGRRRCAVAVLAPWLIQASAGA